MPGAAAAVAIAVHGGAACITTYMRHIQSSRDILEGVTVTVTLAVVSRVCVLRCMAAVARGTSFSA